MMSVRQGQRRARIAILGATSSAILLLAAVLASAPAIGAGAGARAAPPLPWQGLQASRDVVRGTFTQKKYLAELDRPLISTGRFVVARGRGLIWQVEKPLSTQMVITRQQLVERSDGRETARITAAQQPGLAVVAAVLLAVFQGDMDRLQPFFDIQSRHSANGRTRITLRPATKTVAEFVQRVQIAGAERIDHLRIDQPGGDYSLIDLKADAAPAQADQRGLSADEKAAF